MTNRDLQIAIPALNAIMCIKLPVKTSLKLRSMARSLTHLWQDVEAERAKLIEQFSRKDDDGKPVLIDAGNGVMKYDLGENEQEFSALYNEMMACQVACQPAAIKAHELVDIEIEASTLYALGELIVDENDSQ